MEQDSLFTTTVTGVDRDHALARFGDPVTSHASDATLRRREGDANTIRRGTHRERVLREIGHFGSGLTADEVENLTDIRGVWKRVSDLKNMGFIAPTGDVRLSRAGRQAEVLAITDAGREALKQLSSAE